MKYSLIFFLFSPKSSSKFISHLPIFSITSFGFKQLLGGSPLYNSKHVTPNDHISVPTP